MSQEVAIELLSMIPLSDAGVDSSKQKGQIRFIPITILGAQTRVLLDAVSDASIVVLGMFCSLTGTSPTAKFQDSAGTDLTGAFDASGIYKRKARRNVPVFSTAFGKGLQVITGGTNPSFNGVLTYRLDRTS